MKQAIINIIAALVLIAGGYICIADKAGLIGLPQYAYNIIYLVAVIPGCISLSDIVKRLKPELYD